ncbi:MAG: hypothetical protein UY39_C0019G0011 [Candidatus Kaiserbacteria bacterium GW2011_GWC2_49_12]|uniref:Uncharacterized protein n=3 Tax=Parcubacteria group TaxID=1794811 RepID=A0A0G1M852_9BACT|nr:MAG: hypothetical protein UX06_C0024G0011 [Candidatus Giovannonibacteria bacterium GW2011_GWA2_45_21]KKW07149.1 MAG: hypothetical protein UY39_C0019G0011 [Candidatus Kaiserbacteria bacterium GW2011_GWC2_49_12]OGG87890.1 MAG: hypothetical protein A3H15_00425 [Candidatus Kaiserbacteria bacterium RIFCSPLOWO2_12_FULL_50_28]
MIPLETFKKSLGEWGKHLPDHEAEKLMHLKYKLANTLFDLWQHKNKVVVGGGGVVVIHKQNGNACPAYTFGFIYAYA